MLAAEVRTMIDDGSALIIVVSPVEQLLPLLLVLGVDGINVVVKLFAHLFVVIIFAVVYLRAIAITFFTISVVLPIVVLPCIKMQAIIVRKCIA